LNCGGTALVSGFMEELTCPKCQGWMRAYERNRVVVDQCVQCRGIFLDRGELEALLDAEAGYYEETAPATVIAPLEEVAGGMPYRAPVSHRPLRLVRPQDRASSDAPSWGDDDDGDGARYEPARSHQSRHAHERRRKGSFLRQLFE
jgi:Zn-finger nucleic acid-binding protein